MNVTLEDFVPYDESLLWRIHHKYFERSGISPWTSGVLPYHGTSNFAFARQNARFLVALARELDRSGSTSAPLQALEVGSGLGVFVANLFRALEHGCGRAGRALLPRLRYVLSDYSEGSVREAVRDPRLAALVAQGRVVPAVLDVARPERLVGLDGAPIEGAFAAIVANYMCCVTRFKVVRKTPEGFFEKRTRVSFEAPITAAANVDAYRDQLLTGLEQATQKDLMKSLEISHDWRPVELDTLFPTPRDAAIVRDAASGYAIATVLYPYLFFDFLRAVRPRLVPGAAVVVSDFGTNERWVFEGFRESIATQYGNTLNHEVNFALFNAFSRAEGVAVVRTRNAARAVHTAVLLEPGRACARLEKAFRRTLAGARGSRLVDFQVAGETFFQAGQFAVAARFFSRCLALDPGSPEVRFRVAMACAQAGFLPKALRHFRAGHGLAPAGELDFLTPQGDILARLGRYAEARAVYEEALAREESPGTLASLGLVLEHMGDARSAWKRYRRSLELDSNSPRAQALIVKLWKQYPPANLETVLPSSTDDSVKDRALAQIVDELTQLPGILPVLHAKLREIGAPRE